MQIRVEFSNSIGYFSFLEDLRDKNVVQNVLSKLNNVPLQWYYKIWLTWEEELVTRTHLLVFTKRPY